MYQRQGQTSYTPQLGSFNWEEPNISGISVNSSVNPNVHLNPIGGGHFDPNEALRRIRSHSQINSSRSFQTNIPENLPKFQNWRSNNNEMAQIPPSNYLQRNNITYQEILNSAPKDSFKTPEKRKDSNMDTFSSSDFKRQSFQKPPTPSKSPSSQAQRNQLGFHMANPIPKTKFQQYEPLYEDSLRHAHRGETGLSARNRARIGQKEEMEGYNYGNINNKENLNSDIPGGFSEPPFNPLVDSKNESLWIENQNLKENCSKLKNEKKTLEEIMDERNKEINNIKVNYEKQIQMLQSQIDELKNNFSQIKTSRNNETQNTSRINQSNEHKEPFYPNVSPNSSKIHRPVGYFDFESLLKLYKEMPHLQKPTVEIDFSKEMEKLIKC